MTARNGPPDVCALLRDPARVREVEPEAVPALLAELERVRAALWGRLHVPAAPARDGAPPGPARHLTAGEVAKRLGVSPKWCYDHATELGAVRLSRRALRFPERAVTRYLAARRRS